ncbi:MAG TPA: GNAT family N-acetyltransferase [Geminicoccaceae bacterium]
MARTDPGEGPWSLRRVERPEPDWYRELFRRIGTDWLWTSRLGLSDEDLARVIRRTEVEVYTLRLAERDEGLLELDFCQAGECELAFFGLTPGLVGRGAGRWLMNRAIDIAWSRPIGRFWVHTCTLDHPAALPFYVRSGFRAYRREVEVSDDPRLTGVVPRTAAAHIPIV